jgi:hypothetical protein
LREVSPHSEAERTGLVQLKDPRLSVDAITMLERGACASTAFLMGRERQPGAEQQLCQPKSGVKIDQESGD